MLTAARFLRCFVRPPRERVVESEVRLEVDGAETPATLLRPRGDAPRPGWIVLHGITVPGRHHPSLLRFCRALAGSGATVLIPEVEPWRRLRIDPTIADHAIAAAARLLAARPDVRPGGVGVVGFSFGATQALVTAGRPEMEGLLRSVVGFGGYGDLRHTLRFMMLGEHEWQGAHHRLDPDPYGRWIVAANYLTRVPGMEGMEGARAAARALAEEAGRSGVYAGDAALDPLKARLAASLAPAEREVWALIAPPAGRRPPEGPAGELAERLVDAALLVHPELDPGPVLPTLRRRVVLAHGHADQLIPYTETLRLQESLTSADVSVTITRLFAHSREADPLRLHQYPLEALRYLRLLDRALR